VEFSNIHNKIMSKINNTKCMGGGNTVEFGGLQRAVLTQKQDFPTI